MRVTGRVIGVDPGNVVTGFGVIEGSVARPSHIAAGTIRPPAASRGGERLQTIYERLLGIIDQYEPAAMSLERSFVAANVQSAFRLGEARAMAMLAAAARGLALFEYTPNEVKLTVAGHGHADKAQVKFMVRRALGVGEEVALADDASDALAIALCHLFCARVMTTVAASAQGKDHKQDKRKADAR
ncbi:MAG: crossover junction endodeoxyribonuclease RuvC [Candidatus Binataceae bacterium]